MLLMTASLRLRMVLLKWITRTTYIVIVLIVNLRSRLRLPVSNVRLDRRTRIDVRRRRRRSLLIRKVGR